MANNAGEGMRAQRLVQKREEEKKQQQKEREQIRKDNAIHISSIDQGFVTKIDHVDDILVQNTVGLVTLDDYRKKKELIEDLQEKERRREDKRKTLEAGGKKKRKKKRKVATSKLSFGDDVDDDEGEAEGGAEAQEGPARLGKNPNVDTTFLPDRDRAEADERARHELKLKWLDEQNRLKQLPITITYSYWDGRGHRKDVTMKQGNTIESFLRSVAKEFPELRGCSTDDLMYIKEDLIIPMSYTFYDLIVTKARGKSGPLFNFDVHDDVRLVSDVRIEKNESHAGKVVERRWYERNKHIFPASRWEIFDPTKDYGEYTIHGGEVRDRNGKIGADL